MSRALAIIVAVCAAITAQPVVTTVSDTIYNAILGTPFNGSVIVQGPNVTAPTNVPVLGISRVFDITNGVLEFSVIPNQTAAPTSTYQLTFSNGDVKTCNIPYSPTPLTLAQAQCVDGGQPVQAGQIALTQLVSGGATVGQAMCFLGAYWGPGSCGGGGNATTINGAALPASAGVIGTNSSRQIVSAVPIQNTNLTLTAQTQSEALPNTRYVPLTDGTGDSHVGYCAVFGSQGSSFFQIANGMLVPADPTNPNNKSGAICLMGSGTTFNITPGQFLVYEAGSPAGNDGIIQGNKIPAPVAVANLYACGSTTANRIATVNDALSPTFLGTVSGGGSTYTPVICNGTNWVAF
jgi:hypothetical protein